MVLVGADEADVDLSVGEGPKEPQKHSPEQSLRLSCFAAIDIPREAL